MLFILEKTYMNCITNKISARKITYVIESTQCIKKLFYAQEVVMLMISKKFLRILKKKFK
jgi:hypothetical protein